VEARFLSTPERSGIARAVRRLERKGYVTLDRWGGARWVRPGPPPQPHPAGRAAEQRRTRHAASRDPVVTRSGPRALWCSGIPPPDWRPRGPPSPPHPLAAPAYPAGRCPYRACCGWWSASSCSRT